MSEFNTFFVNMKIDVEVATALAESRILQPKTPAEENSEK